MATEAHLNSIPELLDDIRAGQMIVLMDDEDRETSWPDTVAA
jgi:3,4-dihydroxy-2-butanone 4-phosphate synthase